MNVEFKIVERYVPTKELFSICLAIDESQKIREESWDEKKGEYELSIIEATKLAVNKFNISDFWEEIIIAWNNRYWNDIQNFTKYILNK